MLSLSLFPLSLSSLSLSASLLRSLCVCVSFWPDHEHMSLACFLPSVSLYRCALWLSSTLSAFEHLTTKQDAMWRCASAQKHRNAACLPPCMRWHVVACDCTCVGCGAPKNDHRRAVSAVGHCMYHVAASPVPIAWLVQCCVLAVAISFTSAVLPPRVVAPRN